MTSPDDWPSRFKGVSPGAERKALYALYLRSAHWKAARADALERAEGSCQTCNASANLHVHHRTYERVGEERPADLIVLCAGCHSLFHDKSRPSRKKKSGSAAMNRARVSADAIEKEVRLLVTARVQAGEDFTTGKIVNWLENRYSAARVSTALRRMTKSRDIIKLSKRRWQIPVKTSPLTGRRQGKRAASVLAVARVLESGKPLSAKEIGRITGLTKVKVDAAIGSLNYRGEIERTDDRWRATHRLHALIPRDDPNDGLAAA